MVSQVWPIMAKMAISEYLYCNLVWWWFMLDFDIRLWLCTEEKQARPRKNFVAFKVPPLSATKFIYRSARCASWFRHGTSPVTLSTFSTCLAHAIWRTRLSSWFLKVGFMEGVVVFESRWIVNVWIFTNKKCCRILLISFYFYFTNIRLLYTDFMTYDYVLERNKPGNANWWTWLCPWFLKLVFLKGIVFFQSQ